VDNRAKEWRLKNNGTFNNPKAHALKALEEMVELCIAFGCNYQDMENVLQTEFVKERSKNPEKIGKLDKEGIKEELADCIICLQVLAHETEIDLEEVVDDKWGIINERIWKPDQDGVLRR
jgi:NTP pyrophosphatase (non-canonical NTP hydrolase)